MDEGARCRRTSRSRARRSALTAIGVLFAGVLAACPPQPDPGGSPQPTRWLIPAGQHFATGERVELTTADAVRFDVTFDASAEYTSAIPENQHDWNKLRGLSDCGTHHQTNSARFGWRWTGDAVEVGAYTYVGGTRAGVALARFAVDSTHELSIELDGPWYRFTVDGTTTSVPRGCTDAGLVKYHLWPYFGGDEAAPHDVTITILER